jgi:hypothetical protein
MVSIAGIKAGDIVIAAGSQFIVPGSGVSPMKSKGNQL